MGVDTSEKSHDTNHIGRRKVPTARATKIRRSIEINRPPDELYRYWRALDNLPHILSHVDSIKVIDDRVSHWTVKTTMGGPTVEWYAEIINDVENERIGWRSLKDADVDHAGSVQFQPLDNGQWTAVTVALQYVLPGGVIGSTIAKVLGEDPDNLLLQDLQRFKQAMEAGVHALR